MSPEKVFSQPDTWVDDMIQFSVWAASSGEMNLWLPALDDIVILLNLQSLICWEAMEFEDSMVFRARTTTISERVEREIVTELEYCPEGGGTEISEWKHAWGELNEKWTAESVSVPDEDIDGISGKERLKSEWDTNKIEEELMLNSLHVLMWEKWMKVKCSVELKEDMHADRKESLAEYNRVWSVWTFGSS